MNKSSKLGNSNSAASVKIIKDLKSILDEPVGKSSIHIYSVLCLTFQRESFASLWTIRMCSYGVYSLKALLELLMKVHQRL
jgi:hypothetical protein